MNKMDFNNAGDNFALSVVRVVDQKINNSFFILNSSDDEIMEFLNDEITFLRFKKNIVELNEFVSKQLLNISDLDSSDILIKLKNYSEQINKMAIAEKQLGFRKIDLSSFIILLKKCISDMGCLDKNSNGGNE
jgi:hypothetical protein